ncbi:hypothetical protein DdX_19832 [Ditylenchus destructor]|uniref:Uncharacterized protein n=1 Tax=Ditylenchus destructor TaxID=166010 RepID=A0AAD4MMH0_9BILA|nr:hypothetical protein DdX_19832 [Ditylenchus destructor]
MLNGERREWTTGGNPRASAMNVYLEWICESWSAVTPEMVKDSFKVCGVTSVQDGSEDENIHCFKPDAAIP